MEPILRQTIRQLAREGRFSQEKDCFQHGSTSVYAHSVRVAACSLRLSRMLRIRTDQRALVRGALLHDYFLYDWHKADPSHRLHGFYHPGTALRNARQDFALTPREENIIHRHMFPLTPMPPTTREAWIVCLADKYCAAAETVEPVKKKPFVSHFCGLLPNQLTDKIHFFGTRTSRRRAEMLPGVCCGCFLFL